jgi:spiro-SPASM protein
MKRALVLHVDDHCDDSDLTFCNSFIPDLLSDRISSSAGISDIIVSIPSTYQGKLRKHNIVIERTSDDIDSWKEIVEKTDAESVIKIYADTPFIDSTIINEMCDIHEKYLAEFTYSENLPEGLSCEIFSTELIRTLPTSDEKRLPLSKVIKSNINQFDVELYYKAPDIRDKRLSFRNMYKRERKIMELLYGEIKTFPPYETIKKHLEEHCNVLYVAPSYIECELTGKISTETIYSWRKAVKESRGDMDTSLVSKIISDMRTFALPYTVCLGGAGDPLLHPSLYSILKELLAESLIYSLIVETDGPAIDDNFIQFIEKENDPRITIIVEMNGYNKETYSAIHGADYFESVEKNIIALSNAMGDNAKNLFVQLMKINETEPFVDAYYDYWEKQKVQILLQKQNIFLGSIEDRRYYDLTPLDRTPCWHLQRDMFILSDGRIGFCKQDINGQWSQWNVKDLPLADIWKSKENLFINDYRGKRATSPDCSKCDEWYTFNM